MRPNLFYADYIELPLPKEHSFPADKYRLTREKIKKDLSLTDEDFSPSPLASREDLLLVHDTEYVDAVINGSLDASAQRRIGFPWSPGLVRRCLASTGGTYHAALDALKNGYGAQLAGGTHHAHYDFGAGYCVFNDFAVTVAKLRKEGFVKKAAIIDLDVHHGDGNASLMSSDPDTFVFSMHGAKNYPSRKPSSDLDIALENGAEDREFCKQLEKALRRVAGFKPEIILYQAGVDALHEDTLGYLSLTHQGLQARDRLVFEFAISSNIPIVHVLGGGYGNPLSATIQAYTNTFQIAFELYGFCSTKKARNNK